MSNLNNQISASIWKNRLFSKCIAILCPYTFNIYLCQKTFNIYLCQNRGWRWQQNSSILCKLFFAMEIVTNCQNFWNDKLSLYFLLVKNFYPSRSKIPKIINLDFDSINNFPFWGFAFYINSRYSHSSRKKKLTALSCIPYLP